MVGGVQEAKMPSGACCLAGGLQQTEGAGMIIGGMEKKMETTILYWGYIRIVEKKMETTGANLSLEQSSGKTANPQDAKRLQDAKPSKCERRSHAHALNLLKVLRMQKFQRDARTTYKRLLKKPFPCFRMLSEPRRWPSSCAGLQRGR